MIEAVYLFCGSGGLNCTSLGEVIDQSIQQHVKAVA